uniref:LP1G.11 n=1 Tax=Lysinibacillus sphaericus TaxID=1421 RepID=Q7WYK4_LYSSH|nr:LP1G.11 [Lysinibacillus sphaericus]
MNVFDAIKTFVDKIFRVPISFLDLAREKLQSAGLITRQGLNFSSYMSIFRDLPSSWQLVLSSLLLMTVLLASLVMFRVLMRLYFTVKSGVQWW